MSLPNEIIERLVMDRELNELSNDAAALLDHYFRDHPDAAVESKRLTNTIELARTALAPVDNEMRLPLPRFPVASSVHDGSTAKAHWFGRFRDGTVGFAAAAVIALSFWWGGVAPVGRSEKIHGTPVAATGRESSGNVARGGFWSWSNFRSDSEGSGRNSHQNIEWIGPVSWPKMGASS